MTISYQFGDVDAHGATIPAWAASLEAGHQASVRDELSAGDFWGSGGSMAGQEFITQRGRNLQMVCEHVNAPGQKLQTAGSNMTSSDSAVGLWLGLIEFRNNGDKYHEPTPAIPASELEWTLVI